MRDWRPVKATKLEVLDFIRNQEVVSIHSLMDWFGYSYSGANRRLWLLKREKLVVNIGRGEWVLTDAGARKLDYHGMLEV
jgi:hypothetical protein